MHSWVKPTTSQATLHGGKADQEMVCLPFLNDDDEFTEEVTSVAVLDSVVSEYVPHFVCAHSHASCC